MLRAAPGSLACGRCAGWFAEGRIWVKVSGAYRVSRLYPDYPDAQPIHEALVAANPDQITWGTDWPHPRLERDMPDDGHLLDLFNRWTPDTDLRRKILVDNPARLYGFEYYRATGSRGSCCRSRRSRVNPALAADLRPPTPLPRDQGGRPVSA
jgi:hypothetical protein